MLRYTTAGESHGECLIAVIDGIPYGTPLSPDGINAELARRQGGYGRGARMKIEKDEAAILTGVREGHAIGSPVALRIANRVHNAADLSPITKPRPGHADLAGAMKFGIQDARDVAERASARETAARVAAGACANGLLELLGIRVLAYVVEVGGAGSDVRVDDAAELLRRRDASEFYSLDPALDGRAKVLVDEARQAGDTLGGVFEVRIHGAPPGLGSHANWDDKLDGALARALMSIQSVKGVEVGLGFAAARGRGSQVHDEIVLKDGRLGRSRNNAGGLEGGMTDGETVILRAACKPIATLRQPLRTVDLKSGEAAAAQYERSDVCVAPAASVVGQAVAGFEIARALLGKFGGDTFSEVRERCAAYRRQVERYGR